VGERLFREAKISVGLLAVNHDPANAAVVRHSIAADLADRAVTPERIDDVVLVASELVSNAVVHSPDEVAGDDLDVAWDIQPDCVVIRVVDTNPELPHRRPATETDTRGRGLSIVAALALDWGVKRTASGKQVWARVPIGSANPI
jgi:anti-sigma regulatory factor (Ser/Thr protein kinase)